MDRRRALPKNSFIYKLPPYARTVLPFLIVALLGIIVVIVLLVSGDTETPVPSPTTSSSTTTITLPGKIGTEGSKESSTTVKPTTTRAAQPVRPSVTEPIIVTQPQVSTAPDLTTTTTTSIMVPTTTVPPEVPTTAPPTTTTQPGVLDPVCKLLPVLC